MNLESVHLDNAVSKARTRQPDYSALETPDTQSFSTVRIPTFHRRNIRFREAMSHAVAQRSGSRFRSCNTAPLHSTPTPRAKLWDTAPLKTIR